MEPNNVTSEPVPPGLTSAQWNKIVSKFELSAQQARVLALVAADKKERVIATQLSISPDTVKEYMKRIRQRVGERNRVGLVRRIYLAANGL